jgi:hypothetical protein
VIAESIPTHAQAVLQWSYSTSKDEYGTAQDAAVTDDYTSRTSMAHLP